MKEVELVVEDGVNWEEIDHKEHSAERVEQLVPEIDEIKAFPFLTNQELEAIASQLSMNTQENRKDYLIERLIQGIDTLSTEDVVLTERNGDIIPH